ncbi:hypothetical protein PMI05_02203 [Brevibacillus sp. BC25]|nr:hypothetical protein PMI05_02203 [Brevibacillus sp. BC25]
MSVEKSLLSRVAEDFFCISAEIGKYYGSYDPGGAEYVADRMLGVALFWEYC